MFLIPFTSPSQFPCPSWWPNINEMQTSKYWGGQVDRICWDLSSQLACCANTSILTQMTLAKRRYGLDLNFVPLATAVRPFWILLVVSTPYLVPLLWTRAKFCYVASVISLSWHVHFLVVGEKNGGWWCLLLCRRTTCMQSSVSPVFPYA